MIYATAWEPYEELFQGVIRCLHSDFRIGGLAPGETKTIRGKIYIVPNEVDALLARYNKDFPEHTGSALIIPGVCRPFGTGWRFWRELPAARASFESNFRFEDQAAPHHRPADIGWFFGSAAFPLRGQNDAGFFPIASREALRPNRKLLSRHVSKSAGLFSKSPSGTGRQLSSYTPRCAASTHVPACRASGLLRKTAPTFMKTIGVAIIGCGGITLQNHLPGLALCAETRVVALCDTNAATLEKASRETGITVTSTKYRVRSSRAMMSRR